MTTDAEPGGRLTFVGPLPPPVTGQTLADEGILAALADREPGLSITALGTQRGEAGRLPASSSLVRFGRTIAAARRILIDGPSTLLLSLERGPGQYLQGLVVLAAVARDRLDRLVVLHHSWDGVTLAAPLRIMLGRSRCRVEHVALCARHGELIAERNPHDIVDRVWTVSNAGWMRAETERSRFHDRSHQVEDRPQQVLMLANLIPEKGVDTFLELARRFRDHADYRFVLAGPCADDEVAAEIERSVAAGEVSYRGPVAADDRLATMAEADLLVLPTRYRTETEPLVVLEALACGVPVLTTGRGCLADLLPPEWIVDDGTVDAWIDAVKGIGGQIRPASAEAAARWEGLAHAGTEALRELARSFVGVAR